MRDDGQKTGELTWVVAGIFFLICFTVFVAFQPTRELICGRYEVDGVRLLLAFMRGDETNCFWGVLYDFQTFITGFAAVIAALVTVRQMRQDARKQYEQHLQMMTASLWKENVTQIHMTNILPIQLVDQGRRMREYLERTDPDTGLPTQDALQSQTYPFETETRLLSIRNLRRIVEDERFETAHLVMSTSMLSNFDALKNWLKTVDEVIGLDGFDIVKHGLPTTLDLSLVRVGVAECYEATLKLLADFGVSVGNTPA